MKIAGVCVDDVEDRDTGGRPQITGIEAREKKKNVFFNFTKIVFNVDCFSIIIIIFVVIYPNSASWNPKHIASYFPRLIVRAQTSYVHIYNVVVPKQHYYKTTVRKTTKKVYESV